MTPDRTRSVYISLGGSYLFCILWVAGVPKINGWVVLAPLYVALLIGLVVGLVAKVARR